MSPRKRSPARSRRTSSCSSLQASQEESAHVIRRIFRRLLASCIIWRSRVPTAGETFAVDRHVLCDEMC